MKIFSKVVLCVCLSIVVGACSRSTTPSKNTNLGIGNYEEDLSDVRVKYDPKPVAPAPSERVPVKEKSGSGIVQLPQQVNSQVDIALDSIAVRNKNVRYSSGYRIQVYVGNDRREVDEAKVFIYQNFPELNTYLTFSQPTYKLKAGDFTSRLDAERYYSFIKQRYSMAMMVPERIDIKKSMQTK
ncbi:MAG: SPOR domain-containing protein [Emticicia sp.]|uniref:SPOR domain-containing protein n=1 Tax=Emticicia sp. TaxID=1930953 RepID=UPI003BA6A40F